MYILLLDGVPHGTASSHHQRSGQHVTCTLLEVASAHIAAAKLSQCLDCFGMFVLGLAATSTPYAHKVRL